MLGGAAERKEQPPLPPFRGGLLDFHTDWLVADNSADSRQFSREDARWIAERFDTFDRLAASSVRFRFALEAAVDWRFSKEHRAGLARLWSGIESFFEVSSELVFRISTMAASVLCPRGPERLEKYRAIKKLYDLRSKAVHGAPLEPAVLQQGLVDSFDLLRRLLFDAVDRGSPRSEREFHEAMFY
jgi:hypothetical protein